MKSVSGGNSIDGNIHRLTNESWAHAIRRYVYRMLALCILFSLLALGSHAWFRSVSQQLQLVANDYHLSSAFHFLEAIEVLRRWQIHQIHHQKSPSPTNTTHKQTEANNAYSAERLRYLIQQKVEAGLTLDQRVNDSRFDALNLRLRQQLRKFSSTQNTQTQKNSDTQENISSNMLITLQQLERLHNIVHMQKQARIKKLDSQQTLLFTGLLLLLLSVGTIITRRGLTAINAIIAEQQQTEIKVTHQAHFDSLTQLPNRFLTLDRLGQLINEAQRSQQMIALLFLDLDDFKKVNDTLGHVIGDKLLMETAHRLQGVIRAGDTVGRLGGDEFVIILGRLDDINITHLLAEKLIGKMRELFHIDGRQMLLTTSVGISIYPKDGDNAVDLLRNADSAMYHAKKSGRNTYSYYADTMNREIGRRLSIEEQLHKALERGELRVLYQPKIDIQRQQIMGAEALLRWYNPSLGNVPPDEFIPIAEQTGLIADIGAYVMTEALAMTARWHRQQGSNFKMAVNLSPCQFRDPQLVGQIQQCLEQHQLAAQHLEVEITEGVILSGNDYVDHALDALHKLNVKIAMDDFGTGYSSLNYLRHYPFDVVKIDRSFITDISNSDKDLELINATIAMAHGLKLKVVAEGVETQDQHERLQRLGCDYAQGYLFSPALPEGELVALYRNEINEKCLARTYD